MPQKPIFLDIDPILFAGIVVAGMVVAGLILSLLIDLIIRIYRG